MHEIPQKLFFWGGLIERVKQVPRTKSSAFEYLHDCGLICDETIMLHYVYYGQQNVRALEAFVFHKPLFVGQVAILT